MAEHLFKKYKKQFISDLGKKALSDDQLDKLGKQMIGDKYIGTFAQDKLPMTSGYFIVNVDTSKRINTDKAHWIGIYQTEKCMYVYDSYGRHTENVLPIIYRKTKKKIVDSKHDPEQFKYTELCGHLSMAFLCVVKELGIRKALTI